MEGSTAWPLARSRVRTIQICNFFLPQLQWGKFLLHKFPLCSFDNHKVSEKLAIKLVAEEERELSDKTMKTWKPVKGSPFRKFMQSFCSFKAPWNTEKLLSSARKRFKRSFIEIFTAAMIVEEMFYWKQSQEERAERSFKYTTNLTLGLLKFNSRKIRSEKKFFRTIKFS